jgi:hypothetical protein
LPARVALALLALYIVTLAPDVTFWDSGEFIAAGWTLGIPHPPGTPLFVLLLRSWSLVWSPILEPAAAMNLFSAACVAAACGIGAWMLAAQTGDRLAAAMGAITAGSMSSVWLNATETEVYGASLLLGVSLVAAAWRYHETGKPRWLALAAYLVVLAVPLHISALLAVPAAACAAWRGGAGGVMPVLLLAGASMAAVGVGRVSVAMSAVGVIVLVVAALCATRRRGRPGRQISGAAWVHLLSAGVALTGVAYLFVRAQHDPAVNQGDPSTWQGLADVISRKQYAVAPLWPRQAPLWVQFGNVLQYTDWQVGLSLGPDALPSFGRTAASILFVGAGIAGGAAHRASNREGWRTVGLLLLSGTVGALLYLNLKAGPSFEIPGLTDELPREARDRDYFFVFGFWAWGLWAGYGAVSLARRLSIPVVVGAAAALVPLALNYSAVDRSRLPESRIARTLAVAMLESAPVNGVLFLAADNDTYPLWYAQAVLGVRRDVTPVTVPLLGARWYREELSRRHALHSEGPWRGVEEAASRVAAGARRLGRPVAASLIFDAGDRGKMGVDLHVPRGLVFVDPGALESADNLAVTRTVASYIEAAIGAGSVHPSFDPVAAYVRSMLDCPAYLVRKAEGEVSDSLDSACNLR